MRIITSSASIELMRIVKSIKVMNMKNTLQYFASALTFVLLSFTANSQGLSYGWTHTSGAGSYNAVTGNDFDAQGNIYETGYFNGTVDFDPGAGVMNMTHTNGSGFIRKLNPSGNLVWAVQIGSSGCNPASLKLNAAGDVFVAGSFDGTGDFNPGVGINLLTSFGNADGFIIRLDSNGSNSIAVRFGGVNNDLVNSMTVNSSGVYLTGLFYGSGDFNPGLATYTLTSAGSYDFYALKVDFNFNFLWANRFGSTGDDEGSSLACDASHLIVTGYFENTVDFDPGSGTANLTSNGGYDIFILKLDLTTGLFNSVVNIGTTLSFERSRAVKVDNSGNIYIGGEFNNTMDFNPSGAVNNLTSNGASDGFVLVLNTNLAYIYAMSVGGASVDKVSALTTDASDNLYVAGVFAGSVDMDPGAGTSTATSPGFDIFISKFNSSIVFQWSKQTTCSNSASNAFSYTINTDVNGNLALGGSFSGSIDFNPGIATDIQSTSATVGLLEMYLPYCAYTYATVNYTVCDSFSWNSNIYTASGVYTDTVTNAAGCDSVITLNLTVLGNSFFNTAATTACDSFQWHNNTYFSSGVYYDSLTTTTGCDSIYELVLTVNNSDATTINLSGCDSVNWYIYTFTVSGSGTYTFTNAAGCDSNVTVFVTIHPVADTTVTYTSWPLDLMSNQANGTYQWINCTTGQPVSNATQQHYVPTANGNYAVIVTNGNGCSDTSDCYTITTVGMEESNVAQNFELFPNPANDKITLSMKQQDNYTVQIVSVTGAVVEELRFAGSNFSIDVATYAAGIYSVNVTSSNGENARSLFVKE